MIVDEISVVTRSRLRMEWVIWIVFLAMRNLWALSDSTVKDVASDIQANLGWSGMIDVDCGQCQEKCVLLWDQPDQEKYCRVSCSWCPLCSLVPDNPQCDYCQDGIQGCDEICLYGIQKCQQCREECPDLVLSTFLDKYMGWSASNPMGEKIGPIGHREPGNHSFTTLQAAVGGIWRFTRVEIGIVWLVELGATPTLLIETSELWNYRRPRWG
eukprot:maker-scaffold167_size293163-snap-gene-1.23 protein:Tk08581 transcript:maker-scaffold167_size293163-snap-gene-1.23-mRNA-1 annotation:"hypothetical protein ACD_8C00050G0007"